MSKEHFFVVQLLAGTVVVMAQTGCSSLSQQAAPVEIANTAPVTRATPVVTRATDVSAQVAVVTPYRADTSVSAVATPIAPSPVTGSRERTHVVKPGENLFRISLSNGLKYQDVAAWNNLPDYNIKAGQVIRLTPPGSSAAPIGNVAQVREPEVKSPQPATVVVPAPAKEPPPVAPPPMATQGNNNTAENKNFPKALKLPYSADAVRNIPAQSEGLVVTIRKPNSPLQSQDKASTSSHAAKPAAKESSAPTVTPDKKDSATESAKAAPEDGIRWAWPTTGKVVHGYSDSNKGIDISGRSGQAVIAAADGKVVYSGTGLRGYGKLIIIKHNKTFLSAYAHNSQLLVKEGQSVKKGQKIAEMGNSDADQVKLHFEIRRFGKPVDPMQYLDDH